MSAFNLKQRRVWRLALRSRDVLSAHFRRPSIVAYSLLGCALATCLLALLTNPLPSSDSIGRLSSPALEDRRDYRIVRIAVSSSGLANIEGTIPGNGSIAGMRWYVNGAQAEPLALRHRGGSFLVSLQLPPARDRWTIFAIANMGFAHFVPMRTPLFVWSQSASSHGPEKTSHTVAAEGRARAALDFATGDAGSIALAQQPLLHWYSGAQIVFVGWAINIAERQAPKTVFVAFDLDLFRATINADRPDVAKAFSAPAYTRSGFTVTIPSTYIRPGLHHVTVYVLDGMGQIDPSACNLTVAVSTM